MQALWHGKSLGRIDRVTGAVRALGCVAVLAPFDIATMNRNPGRRFRAPDAPLTSTEVHGASLRDNFAIAAEPDGAPSAWIPMRLSAPARRNKGF